MRQVVSEGILERLSKGPILGDGGYVYILRERGLPMAGYSPQDVLTHGDAVRKLQQEFFDAGAEVLQAQTFQGNRNRLEEVVQAGQSGEFEAIHGKALALGVGCVGSCCGSGPEHVRAMAEAMSKEPR